MEKFEHMADRYDNPERQKISDIIADEILKNILADGTQDAMDFGCGTGLVGLQLAPFFKSLLLVDTSTKMIEITRRKIAENGIANAETLCADLLAVPEPDISVDYIFMTQVLLHILDTHLVFEKMYQMMRAGGSLIIVDFDKNPAVSHPDIHNGFKQSELADLALKTGFSQPKAKTFYQGKGIFAKQDASMFLFSCKT